MGMKSVTVVLAVVGGIVLAGTGTAAAVTGAARTVAADGQSTEVEVDGVRSLQADVGGASLTVDFYDGDTAELRAESGSLSEWSLRRDGEELVLHGPRWGFGWWNFGWSNSGWFDDDERITLMLPESLAGLDAELSLGAGSLNAEGEFGDIRADISAGALSLSGSANALDLDVSAGRADVDLAGVDDADYTITAGRVTSRLSGSAPALVDIEVSAGSFTLTLPREAYEVRRDVSAGTLHSDLDERGGAANRVDVTVSAGTVNLRAE